jgi:hypothetical protein
MDDGGKSVHGQTIIHTRAFTLKDVEYIQEVLNKNFELRTRSLRRRRKNKINE